MFMDDKEIARNGRDRPDRLRGAVRVAFSPVLTEIVVRLVRCGHFAIYYMSWFTP